MGSLTAPPVLAWDSKDVAELSYPLPLVRARLVLGQDQASQDTAASLWPAAQAAVAVLQAVHADAQRDPAAAYAQLRMLAGLPTNAGGGGGADPPCVWELGSGLALPGMAARLLGWRVVVSDEPAALAAVTVPSLERNAAALTRRTGAHLLAPSEASAIAAAALDWRASAEDTQRTAHAHAPNPLDMLLTTDTAYEMSLVPPLLQTLHTLATPQHTILFIAIERRDPLVLDHTLSLAADLGLHLGRLDPALVRAAAARFGNPAWPAEDVDDLEVYLGFRAV